MRNTIKRFPNDVVSWWKKVEDDINWAKHNFSGGFYTQTCFVTQQIVEKALKTFLLANDHIAEKIHRLPILLKQCAEIDKSFQDYLEQVKILDRYYITTRYPAGFGGPEGEYTKQEAEDALSLAKEIVEFVRKKIQQQFLNTSFA